MSASIAERLQRKKVEVLTMNGDGMAAGQEQEETSGTAGTLAKAACSAEKKLSLGSTVDAANYMQGEMGAANLLGDRPDMGRTWCAQVRRTTCQLGDCSAQAEDTRSNTDDKGLAWEELLYREKDVTQVLESQRSVPQE
jgi:hypothetical protein